MDINGSPKMTTPKLEYLFNIYAENLKIVQNEFDWKLKPKVPDSVLCPICFDKLFTRKALQTKDITLEHVPPEILGGKERTITCKKCNNWSGTYLDEPLNVHLKVIDFFKGNIGASQKGEYEYAGINLPVTFSNIATDASLIEPRRSNPNDLRNLRKAMDEHKGSLKFKLKFKTYNDSFSEVALLRIAYLWAFSILGYSFLINPNLHSVRHQILNPKVKILPNFGIINIDFPDELVGLNLVYSPANIRCFFVIFDLTTANSGKYRFGVMLPGPDSPGNNIYQWLVENVDKSPDISMVNVPKDVNFVSEPFATYDIWCNWKR